MKKQLLKSMLVGVMTLAASGAWAQTVTTYDFEDGNALFTADSRISASVVEGTQTIYSQDFDLDGKAVSFKGASNAQNGYSFAHYDFSSLCDQAAKVKVEFETVLGNGARSIISIGDASVRGATGNSSKTTYSNKGAIFRVGTDKNYSYVNGSNVGNSTVVSQKWLKVTIEVDEVTKKYTYSIVNKATNEVLFSNGEEPIAFYSSDATNCTQIDMFGYINNSQMGLIDNLIITVTKDEREQANYTVNFLDSSNNPIKEAAVRSGAVGDGITLLPADKDPLWNAESTQKYIYQSDDSEGKTIEAAGTTVVNIIYRDAVIYNYTLLSNLGATLATGSDFEGESPRVAYPRYQLDGTDLYMAAADNKEYRTTVNLTEDNVSKTVTYTLQEGKVVAFYTEAEDIAGITVATNDNIPVRASNAHAATTIEDVTITTLAPGKYILHAGIFTSKSSYSGLTVNFGIGAETFAAEFGAVNLNEVASGEYGLGAPTAITYLASSSDNTQFDYIWIEKTGDVTAEEAAFLNAKAQLQEAIAQATALNAYANDADLTTAIDNATAALADDAATLETLGAAGMTLNQKATAAAKTTLQTAVDMAKSFGVTTESVTAGEALLAKEDATAQELGAALQAICNDAVPAAKTAVSEAKSFFNTFDKAAAADLADEFAALETALEGTDINKIKKAAQDLFVKATPAAKTAIGKVKGYLEVMNNETITQDLAALQAAMDNNDFPAIIAAAKQAKKDLKTAVPAFLTEVYNLIDAGKKDGKNGVDALETAYNDANTAIMAYLAAGDNGSIVPVGEAIYNLVKAVEAYEKANKPAIDLATVIVNPNFEDDEAIATKICTYAKDVQEGQFAQMQPLNGWTIVENGDARAAGTFAYGSDAILGGDGGNAPAAGPNGETEGKALGLEAVWGATALYTQDITLPAGEYLFEAVIYNGAGTAALASNLIGIDGNYLTTKSYPVGQWTTDQVKFTLAEEKAVTVSVGVTAQNIGNGSAPHLFIDHVKLYGSDEIAAVELATAKENALATIEALTVGDALFLYNAADIEAAKTAVNDAKTVDEVNAAVAAALAAQNKPDESKAYAIANKTAEGNLSISESSVTVANDALVHITAVDGGYVLSNDDALYIFKTTDNTWTFSTTANKDEAYVVNFNYQPDGTYTISGANGLFGTDNTTEGSTVWANKTVDKNGYWTITEVVITEDEALQAAKEKLEAEIAAAEAMKTTGRTQGLVEFNAAIDAATAALSATTAEAVTAALQTLKTAEQTFKKANWYINFAAGEYYVIDAETDLKMAAGHDWGTRGIVNELGLDLTLTPNEETHTVTFDSKVSNGGDSHFLGSNLYMDAPAYGWALEYQGFGFYIVDPASDQYINFDADNNLVLSTTPREFIIVTKLGVIEERMDELADAKVDAPVDATFLLQNPNFNRNDQRVAAWEWIPTETAEENAENWNNHNFNGGNNVNNCAESFHAAFTVKQTVEGAPKGMYALTVQGFYRQDAYEGDAPEAPAFFANGFFADVPALTGSENSMAAASESFTSGLYTIEPIMFDVTGEGDDAGKINVGVTATVHNQWVIFDNFKLMYYGPNVTTAISEVKTNGQQANEGIYNLSGQKVMKAGKGLYIINGKKVIR